MIKIAVINQKGGVGKSTISVNLAYGLAKGFNKQTLLVDLDPQAHSCSIYQDNRSCRLSIRDLFSDPIAKINEAILNASINGSIINKLDIILSDIQFARVAEQVSSRIHREKILHNHLRKLNGYDYCIIDCPPNLGVITINAIFSADIILIPITYDKGSLDGMADLIETIKDVKESSSPSYLVLRNMFDIRNKQTNSYIEGELEPFSECLLKTKIRKTEALNQARMTCEPIFIYDRNSNATDDYAHLTEELINYVKAIK